MGLPFPLCGISGISENVLHSSLLSLNKRVASRVALLWRRVLASPSDAGVAFGSGASDCCRAMIFSVSFNSAKAVASNRWCNLPLLPLLRDSNGSYSCVDGGVVNPAVSVSMSHPVSMGVASAIGCSSRGRF